tara:strand:+ start:116 stop:244 length:129 start_codon:yes stop_codon:yes gene_type:complete
MSYDEVPIVGRQLVVQPAEVWAVIVMKSNNDKKIKNKIIKGP